MTHGLPFLDFHRPEKVPGWSADFDEWASEALARGDIESWRATGRRRRGCRTRTRRWTTTFRCS